MFKTLRHPIKLLLPVCFFISVINTQAQFNAGTLLYSKKEGKTYILIAEDSVWSSMGGEFKTGETSITTAARETYEETRESYLKEDLQKVLLDDRSYFDSLRTFKTYIVEAKWAKKEDISERPLSDENTDNPFFNEKKKHVWIPYTTLKNVIDGEDLSIKNFLNSEGRQSDNPTLLKNFALGLKDNLTLVDSILTLKNPNSLIVKFNEKADFSAPGLNGHTNSSTSGQSSVQTTGQSTSHQNDVVLGSGDVSNNSTGLDIKLSKKVATTDETEKEDTFTVALTAKPTSNVVIDISEEDDEGAICPKKLTFTPKNWDKPQLVTVTGIDDKKIDGDVTYPITFLIDGKKNNEQVIVTNKDNDGSMENLYHLEFNKTGQLVGSMDGYLSEDFLVGQMRISKAEYAKEVEEVLKEYLKALQNVESNGKLYDALGIEKTFRTKMKINLLALIKTYLEKYGGYLDKEYYENWITANFKTYDGISTSLDKNINYPKPEEFLTKAASYQLELIFYDDNGLPLSVGDKTCDNCKDHLVVLDFTNKCDSACIQHPLQLATKAIAIPEEASSFDFFLRKKNARYEQVKVSISSGEKHFASVKEYEKSYNKNWIYLDGIYKKALKYKPKISDANFTEDMIKWAVALHDTLDSKGEKNALYQALRQCYGREDSTEALANAVLPYPKKSIMWRIELMRKELHHWIRHWLWLNQGVPHVNPLAAYFKSSSTSVKEMENHLAALKAERDFLNKFVESENLSMDDFSDNYQAEKDSVNKLTKSIIALEQKIAKTKAGNMGDATKKAKRSMDNLLYKGLLKPNSLLQENYQRNHDALQEYQLVGTYRNEITEIERMHVLIHNLTNKDKVDIKFTNEAIAEDQSTLEEGILGEFSTENVDSIFARLDKTLLPPCNKEFIVKTYQEQVLALTKWMENRTIMRTPPIGTRDINPDYFSKEWKHTVPNVFASHVNYTITDGEGDSKTTEFEGRYRMNKLYRFRLKAGLVYSRLKSEDYTVDINTGEVTSDIEQYGLTATAGVQIFWRRYDIRRRYGKRFDIRSSYGRKAWGCEGWYSYIGLGLREEPFQNWLVGVGKEVSSGVGIMGGVHIGTTEKLDVNGGVITVEENRFNYGGFASIIIDLSVFQKFFSLRNIDNPIKGK